MKDSPRTSSRAWLQLLRPPNLFTVPGDPLAGYLIANAGIWAVPDAPALLSWPAVPAMLSSLFLYAAGLVMNDLADYSEDLRERPERPLPSGEVKVGAAWALTAVLVVAGLASAWLTGSHQALLCAVGLLAAIAAYNFATKRLPFLGALNMGLCRSLSVLVGALAGPLAIYKLSLMPAVFFGLYIAAVTNLARHETRPSAPGLARILPAVVMLFGCAAGAWYAHSAPAREPAIALFALAALAAVWFAVKLFSKEPPSLPPIIGSHIRLMLPLQAANCYVGDPWIAGPVIAVLFLALWPLSAHVSKRFYAS